ncbi:hypothetical protein SAMN02745194_04197 [Roseomonas rosea]|uniref:YCII-related domain-containing protein n=1 Tax=Muricoccus roseus TaxID=198092 RepID=A0A1M6PTS5_9PROT|nr:YciI family protein [Roseomonas rosea]SHK11312.1 hypothetical protein SAMN02745194_04197 [Roseomonas rosea]
MTYLVLTLDKPGHRAVRDAHRADHYAYLIEHQARILAGGGLQDEEGGFIGGATLVEVETLAEAESFAAGDPLAKAGLFAEVKVLRWKKAFFDHARVPPA